MRSKFGEVFLFFSLFSCTEKPWSFVWLPAILLFPTPVTQSWGWETQIWGWESLSSLPWGSRSLWAFRSSHESRRCPLQACPFICPGWSSGLRLVLHTGMATFCRLGMMQGSPCPAPYPCQRAQG